MQTLASRLSSPSPFLFALALVAGCDAPDDSEFLELDSFRSGDPVVDECPDDEDKTEPGICGCGVPDDETGCMSACPKDFYDDPVAYLEGLAENANVGACVDDMSASCDGSKIVYSGAGDVVGAVNFSLHRPPIGGYSSGADGGVVGCDGTGYGLGAGAVELIGVSYTCQQLFDEACASLQCDEPGCGAHNPILLTRDAGFAGVLEGTTYFSIPAENVPAWKDGQPYQMTFENEGGGAMDGVIVEYPEGTEDLSGQWYAEWFTVETLAPQPVVFSVEVPQARPLRIRWF